MTPTRWSRVKEIFGEAIELRPSQRDSFVRQAAGDSEDVQSEVTRLLKLHDEPSFQLDETGAHRGLVRSAEHLHAFFPGEVLAGRYSVRRFIAEGGMGEVYEAEDMQLGERVALKTLRGEIASEDHVVWLRREIQAARRISHPNVCRVFDLVQTTTGDGRPAIFLTMELLDGETLSSKLRREGAMSERQILPVVRQMVAALTAAHQAGIIHRDFKTGNVMIVHRGSSAPRIVVTDFGLARPESRESRSASTVHSRSSSLSAGTPAYMAPEQMVGGKATPATDIYALGVVLHELLTGELPFNDDSPLKMALRKTREQPPSMKSLAPTVRSNWNRAVLRCLEPEPKRRYSQARDLLEDLEVRSRPLAFWRRLVKQRKRYFRAGALSAGITLLAGTGWWLLPANPDNAARKTWESGLLALHMNEPLMAASRLEEALESNRLPAIAHAQLGQAWFEAGFPHRAKRELAVALRKPFQSESDSLFARAVEAQIDGKASIAKDLLARRGSTALADLAHLDETRWPDVLKDRPQYAPAILWNAVHLSKLRDSVRAEREFLTAETYLRARGDTGLVRVVSARRGLTNIAAGEMELARQDLPLLEKLPLRPKMGYGVCERVVVLTAGVPDNFAMPPDRVEHQSEALSKEANFEVHRGKQFDEWIQDAALFVSVPVPSLRYCSGEIEMKIRRRDTAGSTNDMIFMLGVGMNLWLQDTTAESLLARSLDIAKLNALQSGPNGLFLDMVVQDDTSVDYIKITLIY